MIHILHISDIHLGTLSEAQKYRTQLETDLIKELEISWLDYIVISGDIANNSIPDEYNAAFAMTDSIAKRFKIKPNHIIIVPGNHDLNWDLSEGSYKFINSRNIQKPLIAGQYIQAGEEGVLLRDESLYRQRFRNFNDYFYKKLSNGDYPLDYADQGIVHFYQDVQLLFLCLNSSWEIDHKYRERSGINMNALSRVLDQLQDLNHEYDNWLKIAVLHHPVTGRDMINDNFMELLTVHGFQICMHGHIHEAKEEFYNYDSKRGIHIIGAGTFGAPVKQQVTGIPLQYNILTIDKSVHTVKVSTRKKEKPDGTWTADARWGDKKDPKSWYVFNLKPVTTDALNLIDDSSKQFFGNGQNRHTDKNSNIVNPFFCGGAVPPEQFVGRDSTLSLIRGRLGGVSLQSVSIVGEHRIGKSSILRYVSKCFANFFDNTSTNVIYLDLMKAYCQKREGFTKALRLEINKLIGYEPWKANEDGDLNAFSFALDQLNDNGYRLILCLDEVEQLTKRRTEFDVILEELRAAGQMGQIGMLTSSTKPLADLCLENDLNSPFFNIFVQETLGLFSKQEWQSMVTDRMSVTESELTVIGNLAGGHPFYTQLVAARLWEARHSKEFIDWEHLAKADMIPHWKRSWNYFSKEERETIKVICGLSGSIPRLNLVEYLMRRGFLNIDKQLFSPFYAEWVRNNMI